MRLPATLPISRILAAVLFAAPAIAQVPLFTIGEFDGSQAEFEQESDAYNDAQYYVMPGDYSEVIGASGPGMEWFGPGPELLQDGPTADEWGISNEGFPRAVVPGRPVIDIFFQLTEEQAQADYLIFRTTMFWLGENSSHNIVYLLNGAPFHVAPFVEGETPVEVAIPREGVVAPGWGAPFVAGGNVLSIVREGGGPVDPEGVNNPWLQFDAVELSVATSPPVEPVGLYRTVFLIGQFNGTQTEFEQEANAYNDPQYYTGPGDYSAAEGMSGPGMIWDGPDAEILQDGPTADEWGLTTDGFPRALVPGRPIIDIFFMLDETGAQSEKLIFSTVLMGLGANSYHAVEFQLNGVPFYSAEEVSADRGVTVEIPRGGQVPFFPGANVITLYRLGGGPIDPEGGDNPWIQFDAVRLLAAGPPSGGPPPAEPFVIHTVTRDGGTGAVTIAWDSLAGRNYSVEATNDPAQQWTVLAASVPSAGASTQYTDNAPPPGTRRFYRVKLLP